jgi:hypothetical protein
MVLAPRRWRYTAPRRPQQPHGDPNQRPIRTARTRRPWSVDERRRTLYTRYIIRRQNDGILQHYRNNYMVASERSTRRYRRRFLTLGHIRRFRRNATALTCSK